jgi:hypothetical protein
MTVTSRINQNLSWNSSMTQGSWNIKDLTSLIHSFYNSQNVSLSLRYWAFLSIPHVQNKFHFYSPQHLFITSLTGILLVSCRPQLAEAIYDIDRRQEEWGKSVLRIQDFNITLSWQQGRKGDVSTKAKKSLTQVLKKRFVIYFVSVFCPLCTVPQ